MEQNRGLTFASGGARIFALAAIVGGLYVLATGLLDTPGLLTLLVAVGLFWMALVLVLLARLDERQQPAKEPDWGRSSLGVDVTPEATGLLVRTVESESAGAAAGLQRGDVIGSVNGTVLGYLPTNAARVRALAGSSNAVLQVWRNGTSTTVRVHNERPARGQRSGSNFGTWNMPEDHPARRRLEGDGDE